MPATATAPRTFWSEASLTAAVDAAFAEALAEELAAALAADTPARPAIVLPDTDTLIRQAGVVTGPCPPDPRVPSATGRFLKKASLVAARAAWLLLKHTTHTAGVLLADALHTPQSHPAELPNPDQDVSSADFLEATSEHIKSRGWTQYAMEYRHGVCVLGAQRDLIRSGRGTRATASAANSHLRAVTGSRSVSGWQDRLTRNEAQVHQALLAAAARARAAR